MKTAGRRLFIGSNVVPQAKKNEQTTVSSVQQGQAQLIKEIRPGGWDEALDFGTEGM
jgi:hypothetical protein